MYFTVYGYVESTSIPCQPVSFANTNYIPCHLIPTAEFYRVLKYSHFRHFFKLRLILNLCLWYSAGKSSWLLIIILQSPIIDMFTRNRLLFLFFFCKLFEQLSSNFIYLPYSLRSISKLGSFKRAVCCYSICNWFGFSTLILFSFCFFWHFAKRIFICKNDEVTNRA